MKEEITRTAQETAKSMDKLKKWEYYNLDPDGGTRQIKDHLKQERPRLFHIDYKYLPETEAKYGHLATHEYTP